MNVFLGIDIGGTKIALGIFNENKELISFKKVPTISASNETDFVNFLCNEISNILNDVDEYPLKGIGVGIPGIVKNGVVVSTPNIASLKGCNLGKILNEKFSCEVILGNDANVAALCQFKNLPQVKDNMVYITISSGIGGGIILNGKIFQGDFGSAAEVGHMLTGREGFSCACGNNGCFEAMASGTHLTERVLAYADKGFHSPLIDKAKNGEKISGFDVKQAYDTKDNLAKEIIKGTGELVGELCYNIFMLLNIEAYCIGGGLTAWGEPLFNEIKKSFEKRNKFGTGNALFYKASDSDDAGVLGAVNLLWS